MLSDLQTVRWLLPEVFLVLWGTTILVLGAFRASVRIPLILATTGYLIAAALLFWSEAELDASGTTVIFTGPILADSFAVLWRHLALLVGLLLAFQAASRADPRFQAETQGLLMLLTAGVMCATQTNELVWAFVSLELVSIPTYVLLFLGRRDRQNSEATAKYFFLGILSSAMFLYGLSFLYGVAGTTWITTPVGRSVQAAIAEGHALSAIGLTLMLVGLGFKIAAVPFHFYAPDVYQGTTHFNASLLAVAPKIAGLAVMIRLVVVGFQPDPEFAWQSLFTLSVVTMTLGNACALWQKNLRRLMAYSSIAHAGYLLMGIAAATAAGVSSSYGGVAAVSFYVYSYAIATVGIFAALESCGTTTGDVHGVEQLSGLSYRQPWLAAALALFFLSLAGVPPLVGFWGKLTIFLSTLGEYFTEASGARSSVSYWFIVLAVIGALNAAIAAAYYLRIVAVIYFGASPTTCPTAEQPPAPWPLRTVVVLCALLVIGWGIVQQPLSERSQRAERALVGSRNPVAIAEGRPRDTPERK